MCSGPPQPAALAKRLREVVAYHRPARAVRMPRAFSSAAIPSCHVIPPARTASITERVAEQSYQPLPCCRWRRQSSPLVQSRRPGVREHHWGCPRACRELWHPKSLGFPTSLWRSSRRRFGRGLRCLFSPFLASAGNGHQQCRLPPIGSLYTLGLGALSFLGEIAL